MLGDFTDIRLLLPVTWDDLTVCDHFVHFTRETSISTVASMCDNRIKASSTQ